MIEDRRRSLIGYILYRLVQLNIQGVFQKKNCRRDFTQDKIDFQKWWPGGRVSSGQHPERKIRASHPANSTRPSSTTDLQVGGCVIPSVSVALLRTLLLSFDITLGANMFVSIVYCYAIKSVYVVAADDEFRWYFVCTSFLSSILNYKHIGLLVRSKSSSTRTNHLSNNFPILTVKINTKPICFVFVPSYVCIA